MLTSGEKLSHYKIVSAIGKGGMGEVFLAQDTKLNRQVALKILPAEFAEDKDRMGRFVREAQSASALNHPNIITIYEIGESDGTHFIATEFIDGKTLGEYAKANPLNYRSALEIAIQVASALDEAHAAGIVHRDIKPDNVMIRANGLVKILDFGIAKVSASSTSASDSSEDATAIKSPTMPGMIIGTANYMSPEQAKGKQVDARTDIFSFGVVLYEMIAGQLPFEGENALEMIGAILHKDAKPLGPDVPTEISKLINKCLRKDRDERYQTIKDVGNDLREVKQELELKNLMERTASPNKPESQTQILQATTLDEIHQTTTNQTVASNPRTKYLAAGLLALLLAAGGFFGYRYFSVIGSTQINSIAVMPFENRNSDADTDYLSDGLAESVIFRLTQIPDLRVSPTSSVMRYKGASTDIAKIASELGVDAVMTGRLTKRGDNLNITVELVDARTNKSLWGEQYERKLSELLTTQREIVAEIVSKLQLKLSGESEQKLAKKYTDNNEAYQLYLQGRYHWNKREAKEFEKALEFFKQAIEKDPNYALAYTGLADTYNLLPSFSDLRQGDYLRQAKQAALKALDLDSNLAEAHTSLAQVLLHEYHFATAEKSFRRAIEIDPNYATAHHWYSRLLSFSGRHDEAFREITKALELDPFSFAINAYMEAQLRYAGRFDEALIQMKKWNELFPNENRFHFTNSDIFAAQGKYDQAVEERLLAMKAGKRPEEMITEVKEAYEKGGWDGYGRKWQEIRLEELNAKQAKDPNGYVKAMDYAVAYAWGKDKEKTIEYLNKAYDERERGLIELKVIKTWDFVRDDPRFKELVKRVGIPE
ncbi:MAG: protein kinase [Pyrinomonadaceae bacterium]